jgi:hypothetical protein
MWSPFALEPSLSAEPGPIIVVTRPTGRKMRRILADYRQADLRDMEPQVMYGEPREERETISGHLELLVVGSRDYGATRLPVLRQHLELPGTPGASPGARDSPVRRDRAGELRHGRTARACAQHETAVGT